MFSTAEVAVAGDLVADALRMGEESGYSFLFATLSERLVGYSCYGPVPATESSFDLYWIAVSPDQQRRGLGKKLLTGTEERVLTSGGRRLYVETSCRPRYSRTRAFYERAGYVLEATLEDFYAPGDHKAIYVKLLAPPTMIQR
jgi:ribosomal protein S18 acetylase RimI-like enzyme